MIAFLSSHEAHGSRNVPPRTARLPRPPARHSDMTMRVPPHPLWSWEQPTPVRLAAIPATAAASQSRVDREERDACRRFRTQREFALLGAAALRRADALMRLDQALTRLAAAEGR